MEAVGEDWLDAPALVDALSDCDSFGDVINAVGVDAVEDDGLSVTRGVGASLSGLEAAARGVGEG